MKAHTQEIKSPDRYVLYVFLLIAPILKYIINLGDMAAHPTKLGLSTSHNIVVNHNNHIS